MTACFKISNTCTVKKLIGMVVALKLYLYALLASIGGFRQPQQKDKGDRDNPHPVRIDINVHDCMHESSSYKIKLNYTVATCKMVLWSVRTMNSNLEFRCFGSSKIVY